jgi:transposase-like protein
MRNFIAELLRSNCPKCGAGYLVRSHRKGLERLVSVFGIIPYRCASCEHRFLLRRHAKGFFRGNRLSNE